MERVQLVLEDWTDTQHKLADTETRMTAALDELGLTTLATSVHGLSPVGAAAILAETGDPRRFATARAVVKHAGLAPRQRQSGTYTGQTRLTGKGRPRLRVAAWRAVWGTLQTNTVYAARYRHLTGREHNRLTPVQAQTVIAAAILRHLHAVITTGRAWDAVIAQHGTRPKQATTLAAKQAGAQADGRGKPSAASRTTEYLAGHHGQPVRRHLNPITRCRAHSPIQLCKDRRRTRHRPNA